MNYAAAASDGAGLYSCSEVEREGSFYKKCDMPIEFNNTTGAIAEIRSNNLGVMLGSSSGAAGFTSKFRLRFSDS